MITVVAALIHQEGRLLICQRPAQRDSFALKWEFPGGKVKQGETPARALQRELREELGVEVQVGREVYRTRHRYPEYPEELELIFFSARLGANEFENRPAAQSPAGNSLRRPGLRPAGRAFEQVLWVEPRSLPDFDFLPADSELVRQLASGALRLP